MRIIKLSRYVVLKTTLAVITGCNDAKLSTIDNGIYIAEVAPSNTLSQQIEAQLADEGDVIKTSTAHLVRAVDQDVTVTLDIDQQLINEYNQQHEASYELLPEEFGSLERTVTIPADEVSVPVINLTIKPSTTPNNEAYAIPVRITSAVGPIGLVGNVNHIPYLLTSLNKQKAVTSKSTNKTSLNFKNEIPIIQWAIEYWIKFDSTTDRPTGDWVGPANTAFRRLIFVDNSAPTSLNGVLLRYWVDGAKKIAPCLQCQLDGNYFDSEGLWYPDIWYHIAYTYDGFTTFLYKDGTLNNSKADSRDSTFNNISLAQSFGWNMQVELAQTRLWSKCLIEDAIQEGMSRQISGDSDDLIGYWKCDEGKGNVLKNNNPNGNDITPTGVPAWNEQYNFYHFND